MFFPNYFFHSIIFSILILQLNSICNQNLIRTTTWILEFNLLTTISRKPNIITTTTLQIQTKASDGCVTYTDYDGAESNSLYTTTSLNISISDLASIVVYSGGNVYGFKFNFLNGLPKVIGNIRNSDSSVYKIDLLNKKIVGSNIGKK
jgi:hypothetical protein